MQASAGSAGVAISAAETTVPDEIPRRGAPVPRELEIDGGAEAVTQHALGQRAIGMRGETGVIDSDQPITTGKVLSKGAGMIEMALHTRRDAIESMGDDLEIGLRQRARRLVPHASDRASTTCGKRNHLAIEQPASNTVERLALHVGTELEGMATEMRRHGDVHPHKTAVGMNLTRLGTDIRHAKARSTDHIGQTVFVRHDAKARKRLVDAIAVHEKGDLGTDELRISGLEFLLSHHVGTALPLLNSGCKALRTPRRAHGARGGVRITAMNPAASYARVRVSSTTLAMNSSTAIGTVSLERSRTEMLPASTSFSPRISM